MFLCIGKKLILDELWKINFLLHLFIYLSNRYSEFFLQLYYINKKIKYSYGDHNIV